MEHTCGDEDDNFVFFEIIKLMKMAKSECTPEGNAIITNAIVLLVSLFLNNNPEKYPTNNQHIDSYQLKQIFLPEISTII